MGMRVMAIGDLHLGAGPSRLPEALDRRRKQLGPSAVWRRIVENAVAGGADALVLAGDVVEGERDYFEAFRELSEGLTELLEAGITVAAVAGNHDVHVLPRLADQLEGFRLLGRGGEWERRILEIGGEVLTLHGWSFPRTGVSINPVEGWRFQRGPGPNLGLLHCDRDASGGGYAPVASADLAAAELDGWLLGHIHAPDRLTADWPVGYLGSVTGLDPGETGLHGPWVVTVEGRRITSLEQWGMAPLHWERLAVDLTDIEEPAEAQDRLLDAVRGLDRILLDRREPPEAAGLHVICTGRTGRRREVEALLGALDGEILSTGGAIQYFVHTLQYATRPEMDLETLARQSSPPGVLARQLLLLERNPEDPERQALIEQAGGRFRQQTGQPRWKPLGEPALDDETVAERLRLAGLEVLDRMLAQKEGTS